MIINLSSNGETNHANFINQFTDNIVIKPNSKICLTRVSLVRDGKQTKITIPAGTTMSFRYTPYDVRTFVLNVALPDTVNVSVSVSPVTFTPPVTVDIAVVPS